MPSLHWTIAEAVAADLAAADLSRDTSAAKVAAAPYYELEDLAALKIDAVPVGPIESSYSDEAAAERDYPVEVLVQQQCERDDAVTYEGLLQLLDEIATHLEATDIDGAGIPAEGSTIEFDPATLLADARFLGMVRVEYRHFI
ncbi:hypothetical protein [Stratiformator vulcanicus]|uniref:DUF3168 domain-containing protein n=1 Tax=Stratiformator vulcanicus TaxID=2527980 RepID=A0A517R767_9PLAN|nr:hypothetical protein [Stratiformator vulcanicus]QDT39728.1 hypothetical protein Pan189_41370 [Stratiformator vulcanicus]